MDISSLHEWLGRWDDRVQHLVAAVHARQGGGGGASLRCSVKVGRAQAYKISVVSRGA